MAILGRYVSPRGLITISAELAWLIVSILGVVFLNSAMVGEPVSAPQIGFIFLIYVATFYLMDLYDLSIVSPKRELALNLVQAIGLLCIALGALHYAMPSLGLSPSLVLAQLVLTVFFVFFGRAAIDHLIRSRRALLSVGLIGKGPAADDLARELEVRAFYGYALTWIRDLPTEDLDEHVQRLIASRSVERVVVEDPNIEETAVLQFLLGCKRAGLEIETLDTFYERLCGKVLLVHDLTRDLVFSPHLKLSRLSRVMRRMRDLLLALAGILVTLPASVIVAVAIKLDSPGSVFFVQERVGENGALFKLYKFRSMYAVGGDESEQARDPVTLKRDPRVTRVGNVIRKLHLDEIPQLINVLKGEMSLVGPRPYHPAQALGELPKVLPQFPLRHVVAPGITGWAQVRCNYGDSVERFRERLACDLYYVKHANFLLDLLIMLETVRVILWRRGSR